MSGAWSDRAAFELRSLLEGLNNRTERELEFIAQQVFSLMETCCPDASYNELVTALAKAIALVELFELLPFRPAGSASSKLTSRSVAQFDEVATKAMLQKAGESAIRPIEIVAMLELRHLLSAAVASKFVAGTSAVKRREQGRRGGAGKIQSDPTAKAKELARQMVKARWREWQADITRFSGKEAFARAMLDEFHELESSQTITRWCREWEAERRSNVAS